MKTPNIERVMISVNNVFEKITSERGWMQKVILGGILMFIPVINLFAMGYLWRYAGRVLNDGDLGLPHWEDWGKLFFGGLLFLVVFLGYGVMVMLVGWLLGALLSVLSLGMLGWFPYFPLSIAGLVAPSLVVMGVFSLKKGQGFEVLLWDITGHFKRMLACWDRLVIVNLAFMGLIILGSPLYGFAFFFGFIVLIPYTALVLIEGGGEKKVKRVTKKKAAKKN